VIDHKGDEIKIGNVVGLLGPTPGLTVSLEFELCRGKSQTKLNSRHLLHQR
jgi:hypothetical protein